MFSLIAVATLALGAASSPLLPRQANCQPNFEGTGLSVINSQVGWSVPPSSGLGSIVVNADATPTVPEWYFRFSGQPSNSYVIQSLQAQQGQPLVVQVGSGNLQLANEQLSSVLPEQAWNLVCDSCNTGASSGPDGLYASGCAISSVSTGECVQTDGFTGDQLTLAGCDSTNTQQKFDFYVVKS
jgi:hypothetical protein